VTIQAHLVRCGAEGHHIDWNDFIPPQYEALILQKIEEVGAQKLKPIKEALPAEIDYFAIKAVLCKMGSGQLGNG
jgi:ATP-dependent DNA helicase RecQ